VNATTLYERDANINKGIDLMELDTNQKKYYFQEVQLYFSDETFKNVFGSKNNKTLEETVLSEKYRKFKQDIENEYSEYMDMKLGLFLLMLKQKNDPYYLKFLNKNGDLRYSHFYIKDETVKKKKGIYLYTQKDEIKYIGRSKDPFGKRINQGYGKIHPKNCYIDGQSTNCHLNYLVSENKENIRFYVCLLLDDTEIVELEAELIMTYKPEWNISLK